VSGWISLDSGNFSALASRPPLISTRVRRIKSREARREAQRKVLAAVEYQHVPFPLSLLARRRCVPKENVNMHITYSVTSENSAKRKIRLAEAVGVSEAR
jgi:hypothetical protein